MGTIIPCLEVIYDENTETLHTYATKIRQVAVLLGYGEPQILEVFKNTLPNRLYCMLFPIDDLKLAVERAKRVLTKEKIDRQLSGQSGTTMPFMKVSGNHPSTSKKAVSFNTSDRSDEKIDNLTLMMDKLTATVDRIDKQDTQFKTQIYQGKGEDTPGMTIIIKLRTLYREVDLNKIMARI